MRYFEIYKTGGVGPPPPKDREAGAGGKAGGGGELRGLRPPVPH